MITSCYARNRPSPENEDDYRRAYLKANPDAAKHDNYDIAAVTRLSGVEGHALMEQGQNRSKDNEYHMVYDFIEDSELRRYM